MSYGYVYGYSQPRRRAGGGASEPTITIAEPTFSQDFNAVADGTRLVAGDPNDNAGLVATNPGNLGWDAVRTGAANLSRFSPIVFGGEIRQRTANINGATLANSYIVTPPVTTPTDHYVQWEMDCRTTGLQRLVVVKGADENNRLEARYVPAATGLAAIAFDRVVAGAESSVFSLSPNGSAVKIGGVQARYTAMGTREIFTAIVCNGRVYFRRAGGIQLGDPAGYSLGAVTGNRFGLSTRGDRPDRIDNLKMGNAELAITMNTNHRPWVPKVRASASDPITAGTGTETFSGSVLREQPTRLQWALRDPITGALVKDWALVPLADQTITSSTWAATIRGIPCGLNGRNAYLVGVRPVDASNEAHDELAIFSPKHFYVALNIGLIGQSNAVQLIQQQTTGAYSPKFPGAMTYTRADPPSLTQGTYPELTNFYDPLDSNENRCLARLGDDLSQLWNVPVAFEALAIAARGAGVLGPIDGSTGLPHPSSDWAYIQTHHAFAGGAYDALILSQGENETVAGGPEWEVRWQANLAAYRDPSMSGQPAGTVIPVFYGITGHTYDNPNVVANTTSTIARNLGQANLQNSVSDCILAYHHEGAARKFDEAPAVHYERNAVSRGIGDLARRLSRSIRKYYGVTVESGVGPFATGATRSGAVITVTYDLNGAASLDARSAADSGIAGNTSALTSWQVSADNFATLLTITSAVLSGSTVVITLSADPGGPVRIRNLSCNGPADPLSDGSSYPHGLYADGSYIGALPVHVPLLSTEPAFVGALDSLPPSAAAFSLRRLRTDYTGPAIRVRRSSDNTETDIGFTAGGDLDTTALLAFCGGGDGFVTTWYDQSGNGRNAVQTTAANQPRIVNAGVVDTYSGSARPNLRATANGQCLPIPAYIGGLMTMGTGSHIWAETATRDFSTPSFFAAGSPVIAWHGDTVASGSAIGSISNTPFRFGTHYANGAPYTIAAPAGVGDKPTSATIHTFNPTAPFTSMANVTTASLMGDSRAGGPASRWVDALWEVILFETVLSGTDRQALEANQGAYYGIAVA